MRRCDEKSLFYPRRNMIFLNKKRAEMKMACIIHFRPLGFRPLSHDYALAMLME